MERGVKPVPGFVDTGFRYPRVNQQQVRQEIDAEGRIYEVIEPVAAPHSAELMRIYHADDVKVEKEEREYIPKPSASRAKKIHEEVQPKSPPKRRSKRYLEYDDDDDDDDDDEEAEYIPKPSSRRARKIPEAVLPETPADDNSERYDEDEDEDDDYKPAGHRSVRNHPAHRDVSQDEIKTEEDEEIRNFMESAHNTFLKISSKELTIKAAADILGRPYSFVYSRYQEFCDNVTGKITPEKKKKTSTTTINRTGKKKKKKKKSKWSYNKAKTTGKMIKCEHCPGVFDSESKFKNHSKVHSGNIPTHECTACGVLFSKLHYLMRHRIEIHEEALQCPHCDQQFTVILKYNKHIRTHTGLRPFICKECGQGFFSKFHLEAHFRKHTGERPFMCGLCEKTFTTLENLKSHSNIHKDVKPYPCDQCDERFNSKTGMERHKVKHTGIQPYKCDLCPAAFYQKKDFEQHGIVHTGIKAFKCDLCDFSCTRQHTLKYHKYEHTGEKPFKCDVYGCTAEYTKPQSLKHHKLKHGVPPCNVCNEKFPDMNSLKHHMTIHTGEKPQTCEQCFKVFFKASALKRHMYSHMDRPAGAKSKRARQNKPSPVVNRIEIQNRQPVPVTTQKVWSSEYQVPVIAENEHTIVYATPVNATSLNAAPLNATSLSATPLNATSLNATTLNATPLNATALNTTSLSTNVEETYPQVTQVQVTQQLSYPFTANQYTTLINNAWPSSMDQEEIRRRLLSSFK